LVITRRLMGMKARKVFYGLLVISLLLVVPVSAWAAEPQVSSRDIPSETESAVAEYGSGYRFVKDGWVYLHIEESHMREVCSMAT
jgi:hypothetical protein